MKMVDMLVRGGKDVHHRRRSSKVLGLAGCWVSMESLNYRTLVSLFCLYLYSKLLIQVLKFGSSFASRVVLYCSMSTCAFSSSADSLGVVSERIQ